MAGGKKLIKTQELQYPSTLSIYKRIANLGLAIATLIIAFNLWFSSTQKEQILLQEQADQLGKSLLQQASLLIQPALTPKDMNGIRPVFDALVQDEHVHSAALYQASGKLLLSSDNNMPLLSKAHQTQHRNMLVYVHKLEHQGQIAGFLRLILYRDKVLANQQAFYYQQQQQIPFMLFLAVLMGILVTRAFYKLKYKRYSVKKEYHS